MNFKQLEHEHVAQSWERMKMMLRNCPTHGLNLWMIIQKIYAGLNFVSRNLLDSATGGTFMEITLGEATKLLDNIMANYSQWHTERAPTSKKVNSVEEISSLSEKVDALMKLVASKSAPIDFNDMPLSTLIDQNSDAIDVSLEIISTTMLIEVILILGLFLVIPLIIMVIPMEINLIIIIGTPLILIIILKNLSTQKKFSTLP